MITRFDNYIKESIENKEYNNTLEIISKLVSDGNIKLEDITPEQITDLIIGKNKKYPQFGFESFMLSAADGKMFISEGDKERMGDYIQKIKDLGIECTELERLYKFYKERQDLYVTIEKIEQDLYHDSHLDEIESDNLKKELDSSYEKLDDLISYIKEFERELREISKKVVEKL